VPAALTDLRVAGVLLLYEKNRRPAETAFSEPRRTGTEGDAVQVSTVLLVQQGGDLESTGVIVVDCMPGTPVLPG
jgi:hypothetical protein